MRIGTSNHVIDAKSRINLPAKMRAIYGDNFIITRGLESSLWIYTPEGFSRLEAEISERPRAKRVKIERFFIAPAIEIAADSGGRIVLSAELKKYAGLQKDIVIWGATDHAEIWDKAAWERKQEELESDDIAELMDELEL